MATRFVEIPRATLIEYLEAHGFTPAGRARSPSGALTQELVYVRVNHNHRDLKIVVYTSLPAVEGNTRGCGEDAIRVVLVYEPATGPSFGLATFTRIHRTGTVEKVLARILDRARLAYAEGNTFGRWHCPKCGAPTYMDSKRCIVRTCREARAVAHTSGGVQ